MKELPLWIAGFLVMEEKIIEVLERYNIEHESTQIVNDLLSITKRRPPRIHPLYKRWSSMKGRCCNPKDTQYKRYGGRGIKVHDKWMNDFKAFRNHVAKLPNYGKKGYSLDRINNDGNYEPGNVRWATRHIQSANRNFAKNKSGYVGVYRYYNQGFCAQITINNNVIVLKIFETEKKAAIARDVYIIKNNLTEYKLQVLKAVK